MPMAGSEPMCENHPHVVLGYVEAHPNSGRNMMIPRSHWDCESFLNAIVLTALKTKSIDDRSKGRAVLNGRAQQI